MDAQLSPQRCPGFGTVDTPDPALPGHGSPRDPAPGAPAPCWRDVSMGLHSWVSPAIPGLCKVSCSPTGCRGSSQERAIAHPRPAQPQQQRRSRRRWWAISRSHCWVIQEGSCCFIEEMHNYSSSKVFARLKYTLPPSRPEPRAELSFSGTCPAAAVLSSKAFSGGVEGS